MDLINIKGLTSPKLLEADVGEVAQLLFVSIHNSHHIIEVGDLKLNNISSNLSDLTNSYRLGLGMD